MEAPQSPENQQKRGKASMAVANQSNPDEVLMKISLHYDKEMVVSVSEGIKLIETLIHSIVLEGYGSKKIIPGHKGFKISFITKAELKEIELESKVSGD